MLLRSEVGVQMASPIARNGSFVQFLLDCIKQQTVGLLSVMNRNSARQLDLSAQARKACFSN